MLAQFDTQWLPLGHSSAVTLHLHLLDRLRAVLAPTLVIAGAQDTIAGVAPVVAIADLFPDGHAAVIEECGHFPWVEQPISFRQAIDPFLAQMS